MFLGHRVPLLSRGALAVAFAWKAARCLGAVGTLAFIAPNVIAQVGQSAGEVLFVAGDVLIERSDIHSYERVEKGRVLQQGDRISTSDKGYLYARMADGALLVIRPKSLLHIDVWQYDESRPGQAQIKYTLNNGVARYVSGKGSQAAKEKFRFNTPIAAIGVRGTDFTVLSSSDITRVSVASGGVVVGALGDSCKVEALGPCSGNDVSELFANNANKIVEISLNERRPRIIDLPKNSNVDDKNRPLSSEPISKNNNGNAADQNPLISDDRKTAAVDATKNVNVPPASIQPLPIQPAPAPVFIPDTTWGRWGELSAEDEVRVVNEVLAGRTLISMNKFYILALNPGVNLELPGSGIGQFKMVSHSGLLVNPETKSIQETTSSNARLSVDFGAKRFVTSMDLAAENVTTSISTQGSIASNGTMNSDRFVSQTSIGGAVSGSQASYIYQGLGNNGIEVSGVAHWNK